jgi:hypothetical protein
LHVFGFIAAMLERLPIENYVQLYVASIKQALHADMNIAGTSYISTTGMYIGPYAYTRPAVTALEVNGTISATNFVGNGGGLTGINAMGDRIVSGSVNMIAEQTSGTVRVSGTLAMVNTGNEVCGPATWFSLRVNPSTGYMQMCRP